MGTDEIKDSASTEAYSCGTLNLRWEHVSLVDGLVRIQCRDNWQPKIRRAGMKHAGIHAMHRSFVSALVAAGV